MRHMSRMALAAIAAAALGLLVAPVVATQEMGSPTDEIAVLDVGSVASVEDSLVPLEEEVVFPTALSSATEMNAAMNADLAATARTAIGNSGGGAALLYPLKSGPSASDRKLFVVLTETVAGEAFDTFDSASGVSPAILAANATTAHALPALLGS